MDRNRESDSALAFGSRIAAPVDEALRQLAPTDRTAIQLRYFEGKSLKEVAAQLNINEKQAKQCLVAALGQIRAFLVHCGVPVAVPALAGLLATRSVPPTPSPERTTEPRWRLANRMRAVLVGVVAIGLLGVVLPIGIRWFGGSDGVAAVSDSGGLPKGHNGKGASPQAPNAAFRIGAAAPAIEIKMNEGTSLRLSDCRGKYLLFHLWSTSHQPSVAEAGGLREIFDRFGHDERFAMIGCNLDSEPDQSRAHPLSGHIAWPQGRISDSSAARIPKEYLDTADFMVIVGTDGRVAGRGRSRTRAYEILDRLLARGSVTRSPVRVMIERLPPPACTRAYAFETIPTITQDDAAQKAAFVPVDGDRDHRSGSLNVLNDGVGAGSGDDPQAACFFKEASLEGRFRVDLGRSIAISQINTYSWHQAAPALRLRSWRAPQVHKVYGSTGSEAGLNLNPRLGVDPATCGWSLIALIDTRAAEESPGGQTVVSIRGDDGDIGPYHHLLFVVFPTEVRDGWGHTFYNEVDVVERKPTSS